MGGGGITPLTNYVSFSSKKYTTLKNKSIDYNKREYLPDKKTFQ